MMVYRSNHWHRTLLSLACVSALGVAALTASPEAVAQGSQMVRQLEDALTRATNKYDTLQLQEAERELEEAIAQAHRFGVSDPVLARLHVMLGVVRYGLTQDEQDAYDQFVSAVEVDRNVDIHPDYKTPTLAEVMERARAAVPNNGGGGGSNGGGGGEPEVIGRPEMNHSPVETATFGKPIALSADVPPTVPLYRITLNYRRYGEREFKTIEMRPETESRFGATIPAEEVKTSQIDYFIEVVDRTGKILVSSGGPTSPNNIVVFGSDGTDLPPDEVGDGTSSGRQFVFLQLTVGSGMGFATANPHFHPDLRINPGLALAPLHVNGELGVMITPDVHLAAFTRFQIVERPQGGDQEIFGGRLRWWFDNEGDFQMYTGLGGGYGRVRHTVNLAPVIDFVDTTAEGPIHAGVNFGVAYMLSANFGLVADFYTLILFPDVSAHLDGTVGIRTSF